MAAKRHSLFLIKAACIVGVKTGVGLLTCFGNYLHRSFPFFIAQEEKTRGKAIELLLGKDADVNCQDDVGRTALSYACEMRANDVVRILVKNNVDPDIADDKGEFPTLLPSNTHLSNFYSTTCSKWLNDGR